MDSRHPLFRHLLDNGFTTTEELTHVLNNGDVVTRRGLVASESSYHMAESALDANDRTMDSAMWGRKRSGTAQDFMGRDVLTSFDPEKQAENREANDEDEFRIARASVLPLSDDDAEHGGQIVDDTHRRSSKAIRDEAVGVEFEYQRRSQGREPWMPKKTFAWVRKLDEQRKRQAIIGLIETLGADPRDPEVARWVKDQGYTNALAKLQRKARIAA